MRWSRRARAVSLTATVGLTVSALASSSLLPAQARAGTGTVLSIFAGNGTLGVPAEGDALQTGLNLAQGFITSDAGGNVYGLTDNAPGDGVSLVKVATDGTLTYVMNRDHVPTLGADGDLAVTSGLDATCGLSAAADGTLYVCAGARIVKIGTDGVLHYVAGNGTLGDAVPGPALSSPIRPWVVMAGPEGSVYFTSSDSSWTAVEINRVAADGTLSQVVGTGAAGETQVGVAATETPFRGIWVFAVNAHGDIYLTETGSELLRVPADTSIVEQVSGYAFGTPQWGTAGASVEGPAEQSPLGGLTALRVDRYGDVYFFSETDSRVMKITAPASPSATLTFVAGDGLPGAMTAGPALSVHTEQTYGLALNRDLDLFVLDANSNTIGVVRHTSSVPDAPAAQVTAADGALRVSFSSPDDGGSAISRYEYSVDGASWKTLATAGNDPVRGSVAGLVNCRTYALRVRAINAIGAGPATTRQSVRPHGAAGCWYRDPLSRAQRARLAPVPTAGSSPSGPLRHTKAWFTSWSGKPVVPLRTVARRPLEPGQGVTISSSWFRPGSARLTSAGRATVRGLSESLRRARAVTCEGYGAYGARASAEARLARARAVTVCASLKAAGLTGSTSVAGYGVRRPVIIGGGLAQRGENRRVVVLFRR